MEGEWEKGERASKAKDCKAGWKGRRGYAGRRVGEGGKE